MIDERNFFDEDEELDDFDYSEEEDDEENDSIDINLPEPHEGQQKVLDSDARYKVLLCGRRWGKTLISQIIAIQTMLEGGKVAYVTPEFSLGKEFFKEILKYLPPQLIRFNHKADLYIELITGGELKFFSGEALDSFRGRHFHLAIIDEAAAISNLQEAWGSAIRATLSDYQGKAIFISTPKGQNYFYALFLLGKNREKGFESFHFTTYDNPYILKEEIEAMREEMSDAEFRQEIMAEPMADKDNPFGIENIKKNILKELSPNSTIVYGIDVASHSDYTVIVGLDIEGSMTYFDRFQLPWTITIDRISLLDKSIPKVVDSTGVGDVVFAELQQRTENIQGFKFTSSSKPMIIKQLINDVQKGNVQYNDKTAEEMAVFQYHTTSTGYIKYEAQKGFHDDIVCALAIANHYKYQAYNNQNWKLHYA